MKKTVLLTGAGGFVGRHCVAPLLGAGYAVHALSRTPPPPDPSLTWHRHDLLADDAAALLDAVRPTHLLHLAWYTEHGSFYTSPENHRWVEASRGLLEAFAAAGGARVVMAGTCAEYDWRHGHCTESDVASPPETLYGVCKLQLFNELERFAATRGISAAWARLFFTYGPGEHPQRLVPAVVRALLAGERARCSHGRQLRDYLYVADVADALVAVLDADLRGAVNIGAGRGTAVRDLAQAFADALGRPDAIDFGAIPTRAGDAPEVVADTTRLRAELNWQPSTDPARAVAETIAYWRERHDGKGDA